MKSYQIKDLSITLTTTADANIRRFCNWGCSIYFSNPGCNRGCTIQFSPCPWHTTIVDCYPGTRPEFTRVPDESPYIEQELPNLKRTELEDLRKSLGELQTKVEMQLKQTPEDLDLLESKLKEALADIENQRRFQQ